MEHCTVDLAGPVHYADWGGEGPPVVFIHGLGGAWVNWSAVAPALTKRHRVYAIDLLGHGRTPLAGRKATLGNQRRLLDGFLREVVKEPAALIGNSTGGHLAVMEGAREPGRVASLVLVDPSVPIPAPSGFSGFHPVLLLGLTGLLIKPFGELMLRRLFRGREPERIFRGGLRLCTPHPERISRKIVDAHLAEYERNVGRDEWVTGLLQTGRSLWWHDARKRRFYRQARAVDCPVLIVQGEEDPLVPMASISALVRVRPEWQLRVISRVGHIPMLEAPDEFDRIVGEWLDEGAQEAA